MDGGNALEVVMEQRETYKVVLGLIVMFVIPSILNIINTVIRNKKLTVVIDNIDDDISSLSGDLKQVKDRVNMMFNDNFEESTFRQVEHIFRGRTSIDIDLLIKHTKHVIVINHIDNKDATMAKIKNFVNNVFSHTCLVLDDFKYNGQAVSKFTNSDWQESIVKVLADFIYNGSGKDRFHNYDTLKYQLKGYYDTFALEFISNINDETNY